MKIKTLALIFASFLFIVLFFSPLTHPTSAETKIFTVDASNDFVDISPGDGICKTVNNSCTLRAAVMEANAHIGADTINLPGTTYLLTIMGSDEDAAATGDLDITESLSILGDSVSTTAIEADGLEDRIFEVLGSASTVSISNVVINRGSVTGYGGGMVARGSVFLTGVAFNWNHATADGGTIYSLGDLHMINTAVNSGVSGGNGGGIYASGELYISDTMINSNQASQKGGGLYAYSSSVQVENSYFAFNQANQGGNIYNIGQLDIRDSSILNGSAGSGGGISIGSSGHTDLLNVNFTDNTATSGGGAVSVAQNGFFHCVNTLFDHNNSTLDGGAINIFKGDVHLIQSVLKNNASMFGGAIENNEGILDLDKVTIENNTASATGGGIVSYGGLFGATVIVNAVTISSNSASEGGGIFNGENSNLTGQVLILANNDVVMSGGGLRNSGTIIISGCTIDNNQADNGGGIYSNGQLYLTNCTIHGNKAVTSGGGIFNTGGSAIFNNTISNNVAQTSIDTGVGGGIYSPSGFIGLYNTILYGNYRRPAFPIDNDCTGSISTLDYNLIGTVDGCILLGGGGLDLIGVDPLLADLADNGGLTQTRALQEGSPAIDAANPDGCESLGGTILNTDQRGHVRPYDGDHDGTSRCDIGAFEFPTSMVFLPITRR